MPQSVPWISFLCTPLHLVGYQIYSQYNWFAPTPWDSEILRWLELSISFLDHVDKAPEPHNDSNEFQGLRNDSSCLHQVSLFQINKDKWIWEEKQNTSTQSRVGNDECHWTKACLPFHPSFICILGCADCSIQWPGLRRACAWTMIALAFTMQAEALFC